MTDLNPCPFCGSKRVRMLYSYVRPEHWCWCLECKTEGPKFDTADEAEMAWNLRAGTDWISVENQLPEKNGSYIVTTDKVDQDGELLGNVKEMMFSDGVFWTGAWDGEVTHWQPMPEATT